MQLDRSELGRLWAIVLFNPATAVVDTVSHSGEDNCMIGCWLRYRRQMLQSLHLKQTHFTSGSDGTTPTAASPERDGRQSPAPDAVKGPGTPAM
ncbi:hypothetical protein DPEC_G00124670 [Dallia pectoralis]|uniref:Uncharacterized protein n=1 Tax=Dallia pectoralis TaxID=75939 RepID=A0ACC2GR44_DALPE|nr:hypothetical protein DPEC_G00124670 [Dallia pectoralis]